MPKIFISYRREDSQWPARSLRDALIPHVRDPRTDIFMDIDNIPLGVNFADHIGAQVEGCDVLLALIGPGWISLTDGFGQRRLDDSNDLVRLEIGQALKRGIPVIPILLDGATMPRTDQLPKDLHDLTLRHATEVRHATFAEDAERLIRGLGLAKKTEGARTPVWLVPVIAAGSVFVFGAATLFTDPFNWGSAQSVKAAPPSTTRPVVPFADPPRAQTASPRQLKVTLEHTLADHSNDFTSAIFSPDDLRVVTFSERSAHLWDTRSGNKLQTLPCGEGDCSSAAFAPSGLQIVIASHDGSARVWDVATSRVIATLVGHSGNVGTVAFSPDGLLIVTGSYDKTARIWVAATGRILAPLFGHSDWVKSAAFSPDGKQIVTASNDDTAIVWDVQTGSKIASLSGHRYAVNKAVFSPNGASIATASADGTARIWNSVTGENLRILSGHTSVVIDVAFSPNGEFVATASGDGTAQVWKAATGESVATLVGHSGNVWSVEFSPDGESILTASDDKTARLWDARNGKLLANLSGHADMVYNAVFSSDGKQIVTSSNFSDTAARIWRVED